MEQDTRYIIDNSLSNKGWVLDPESQDRNVYFERPKTPEQKKKLKGKKPDYILYQKNTNNPIAIIEAKKPGSGLSRALEQGTEYALALDVPLVFAMNGAYCETRFVSNNKNLVLNGYEVRELIREVEALKFIQDNSNEAYTIPKQVILSRQELIRVFAKLNDTLRGEGLRAGIERLSEFANILFIKLLSEHREKSHWDSIKKHGDDDLIEYINDVIIRKIENEYGGDVFTPLQIRNSETLREIIELLDPLQLTSIDSDIKGDAFEYFLAQTTSTQNDLGEYFTPRHIIKTIVRLVNPQLGETVYDPFCGTGGFLTEAFNYIKAISNIKSRKDQKTLKHETIKGREITTTARIAKMNMILHGDGHSGVEQIDSLAQPVDGLYDVVITNIPFSQRTKKGELYYNGIAKNNGDSVCILHCLRSLKKGGRMALLVPEGVLFRKDLKRVREFLLSKARLQSIVSLPQGVFLPYTGVKTNILYFEDVHEQNTQKSYWYFNVKNDGYTLDNHRRKIEGQNDFDYVNESILAHTEADEKPEEMLDIGFQVVELEKIKENNWNWVGNIYKELLPNKKTNYEIIGNLLHDFKFSYVKIKKKDCGESGIYPVVTQGEEVITGYTDQKEGYIPKIFLPVVLFGDHNRIVKYIDFEFFVGADGVKILNFDTKKIIPKYAYYCIRSQLVQRQISKQISDNYYSRHFKFLRRCKLPLPSLEQQRDIIKEIERHEKSIQESKEKISKMENKIEIKLDSLWGQDKKKEKTQDQLPESFEKALIRAVQPDQQDA